MRNKCERAQKRSAHSAEFKLRTDHGVAMVIATHNRDLAERADRVLHMKEGQLRMDEDTQAGDDAV